jgi:hypothetical protein
MAPGMQQARVERYGRTSRGQVAVITAIIGQGAANRMGEHDVVAKDVLLAQHMHIATTRCQPR